MKKYLPALSAVVLLFTTCKRNHSEPDENVLLAKVGTHQLFLNEVSANLEGKDAKDSLNVLYSLVEAWCREKVLLEEAVKAQVNSEEINTLVEKYKQSLFIDQLESKFISQKLDSSITDEEVLNYYKEKRAEYKLDGPIIKLLFVKIKKSNLDEKIFGPMWENPVGDQWLLLQKYCADHAESQILNGDKWYKWNEIKDNFPDDLININKLTKGMKQSFKQKDLLYFVRVYDLVRPNEEPPLSFVKEQALRSILYTKKIKALEEYKKELYEKALREKNVHIFVQ